MNSIDLTAAPFNAASYLVGGQNIRNTPLNPYNDEACAFLAALSSKLMHDSAAREFPDVISFAYWCRKSNIKSLRTQANTGRFSLANRLGCGLAFHIAPSNIPVNFAFSFAFGVLAGDANIVRVPSKPFEQTKIICNAISEIIGSFPEILSRTAFVTYPADDTITAGFCAVSDARIIWGGDRTVAAIKSYPASPRCKDIVLPDRYSIAVIKGSAIRSESKKGLIELADRFYNDTYLMDQNACSSPQMIFWENAEFNDKELFWGAVSQVAQQRYQLQPAVVMDKYVQLCEDAIDGRIDTLTDFSGLLTAVSPTSLPDDICGLRGKGGYFYEHDIESIEEMACFINERYQTLLYYGFNPKDLREFVVSRNMRGIDRIVPIGSAMDIDVIWDGYDFVAELSRIVDAR